MTRTIGRKWRSKPGSGDYVVKCHYCGVPWPRSKCTRDVAGRIRCPHDQAGADEVELSMERELDAAAMVPKERTHDGGAYYKSDPDNYDHLTTAEDL